MNKRESKKLSIAIAVFVLAVSSLLISWITHKTKAYPVGNDVYGHLFKVQEIYDSLKCREGIPYYSEYWYSGIELFRYWPPFSYIVCAIIMVFTKDVYMSYLVLLGILMFVGGMGFLLFGVREKRIALGTCLGVIFMLLPDNIRVTFGEGNLPRIFITALLPLFFFFVFEYLHYDNYKALLFVNAMLVLIVYSHIMIAAMLGLTTGMLVIFHTAITNPKDFKKAPILIGTMAFGYLESCFVLIPGLVGGIMSQTSDASSATSQNWSSYALDSLNPVLRLVNFQTFYFGLSVFVIAIIGLLAFRKRTAPLFLSCLAIFMGTTMMMYPVISSLPLSQVFWAIRFVPMAGVLFLLGILYWKELRKSVLLLFITALMIDGVVSFSAIDKYSSGYNEMESELEDRYMLDHAFDIATNMIGIIDLSNMGSYPSYGIVKDDRNIRYLYGWSYQGAYTVKEIVALNDAFEHGRYSYMFDRLLEYGCDTVVVKKNEIKVNEDAIVPSSIAFGYDLVGENDFVYLFKLRNVDTQYGVINNIENVCIGNGSEYISFLFPSFHKLKSAYLDDYTFNDLREYKKIYISGPYYRDKSYCENLISSLVKSGTKVYVDMSNTPEEIDVGRNSLFGVYAQPVVFTESFPVIEMENGTQFKLSSLGRYSSWRTSYLTNLDTVTRRSEYKNGKYLDYVGESEGVTFIGLNLVYYCYENSDFQLQQMLSEIFEESEVDVSKKEIVPINAEFRNDKIFLYSDQDKVTVSIANLDALKSDKDLGKSTFVTINKGETKITIEHAFMPECIIISIVFGLSFISAYAFFVNRKRTN